MKGSRVFLLFDLSLFAVLILPLGIGIALSAERPKAATIYAIALVSVLVVTSVMKRVSRVSLRDYLDATRT